MRLKVTFECEVFPWEGPAYAVIANVLAQAHPKIAYARNLEVEEIEDDEDGDYESIIYTAVL